MKRVCVFLLCLMMALSMSACGSSESASETSAGETGEETAGTGEEEAESEETAGSDEEETREAEEAGEAEEEQSEEYEVLDYVTLGAYTGFDVDKVLTEVDDDEVEEEIDMEMEENAEAVDVTGEAADGDYLDVDYTILVEGEEVDSIEIYGEEIEGGHEEGREIMIGFSELGSDLDASLVGVKAGDNLTVDVTLDADAFGEDLDGKEAQITLTVNRVYTYETPELTEEYVAENTDYGSIEEYKEAMKEALIEENEEVNRYEAAELALGMAVEEAVIDGYPEELYESTRAEYEEIYDSYASMFGMEREELLSDEDLEEMILEEVNTTLVVEAIAQTEKMELTEEDYEAWLEENLDSYGFETVEELYEYYTEEEMWAQAIRDTVSDFILENSQINEMSEEDYDNKYYPADEDEEEDEDDYMEIEGEETDDEDEYFDDEDEVYETIDDEEGLYD